MPAQGKANADRIHLDMERQDDEYDTLLEKLEHYLPSLAPTLTNQRD